MNALETTPDLFIAHLLRDYLASADSIAAGVPDDAALPKWVMDTGKEPPRPVMVVAAKEDGSRGARRVVEVSVIICTWLKADDQNAADVESQTTRAEAMQMLNQIDQRLRDHTAFEVWLASLSEERRTGWTFMKRPIHTGIAPPMRNKDIGTMNYLTGLKLHVFIPPRDVAALYV